MSSLNSCPGSPTLLNLTTFSKSRHLIPPGTRKRKYIACEPEAEASEAAPSFAPHHISAPAFVQSLSDTSAPDSVDPTTDSNWDTLHALARTRLDKYVSSQDRTDRLLARTFDALLEWLPQAGRENIARDIISVPSSTDEGLYGTYG
jgi:hypothetical protein